ncbi:hypothetical protein ACFUOZ_05880, partial [Paenarthrobacter sp. NPDC057355]
RAQVGQGWNVMTAIIGSGDYSGDGNTDLLAADRNGVLWLYPSNGSGGWLGRSQVGLGWGSMTPVP